MRSRAPKNILHTPTTHKYLCIKGNKSHTEPDLPVLAAPKPPAPEPNEKPPGLEVAGVLKLNPPADAAGAPKPPAAGAGAPKGLGLEVGVPNAGVEDAPNGEEPPKAGVLLAPKRLPELGHPKAHPPYAAAEDA